MNDQEFELWLGQELKANTAYVEDSGFTDQLMAQLPASVEPQRQPINKLVLWATIISSAIVALLLPVQSILHSFTAVFSQPVENWLTILGFGVSMGMVSILVLWNDRSRIFEV